MLTEGTQIECHASFNFPHHVFLKMKQEDKHTLKRKRAACCNMTGGHGGNREIQELRSEIQTLRSQTNSVAPTKADEWLLVSKITTNTNIMGGGRKEQTSARDARRATSMRKIGQLCTT
jgi:hypothetical protein